MECEILSFITCLICCQKNVDTQERTHAGVYMLANTHMCTQESICAQAERHTPHTRTHVRRYIRLLIYTPLRHLRTLTYTRTSIQARARAQTYTNTFIEKCIHAHVLASVLHPHTSPSLFLFLLTLPILRTRS